MKQFMNLITFVPQLWIEYSSSIAIFDMF